MAARTVHQFTRGVATAAAVLALAASIAAVIGALTVITEPAVFNASYGCLGRRPEVWLAMALRPTPAPCGYLIPASDEPLFYPAAIAAFGAGGLALTSAILYLLSRNAARA
jgi:hypothetical protein